MLHTDVGNAMMMASATAVRVVKAVIAAVVVASR